MNSYLNSINGWGGGFVGFWPTQISPSGQLIRQVVTGGFGNDKFDTSIAFVVTFGFSIGEALTHVAALGRTAFVARSARTVKMFAEPRTAKVARDPGDAIIPEQ